MRQSTVLVLCLAMLSMVEGFTVSNTLQSNMVLQREPLSAKLWGTGNESEVIAITLLQSDIIVEEISAKVAQGHWSAALKPRTAGGPYSIVFKGENTTIRFDNVLFGDVWFCGGQSNMKMPLKAVLGEFGGDEAIASAGDYPDIRLFTVGQGDLFDKPLENLATNIEPWTVASPAAVKGADPKQWDYFSAACWFFAVDMYKHQNVPLGLINDNWGGTDILWWSSPDAIK
eukprot:Colp12_sorted_trinity150504_noHs@15094